MSIISEEYKAVLDYLYTQLPMFQRVGGAAYKKDLTNTIRLLEALDNPHDKFKSVHIAGTNGKGSCSHYTASILQSAGYKTGLYTSPHLKSFTERIKINGQEIPEMDVIGFVRAHQALIEEVKPSFFEITVAMAFDFFAREEVDIAVIEVGMGGRLDSTNVIHPLVSLITNISMDHQQWLGNTLTEIAGEKAGIIKENIPVVISEVQEEARPVFDKIAAAKNAPIHFATDFYTCRLNDDAFEVYNTKRDLLFEFNPELLATFQVRNIPAVLCVIDLLTEYGFNVTKTNIREGITKMKVQTGLKGRWQVLGQQPKMVCDVGHNEAGVELIVKQLEKESFEKLHIVWGTVNDKDITHVLELLPKTANYYFCQANIPRALNVEELHAAAQKVDLKGNAYKSVNEAVDAAKKAADSKDLIFVGGSTFVVAELDEL